MRLFTTVLICALSYVSAITEIKGEDLGNHLIPIEPSMEQANLGEYRTLYERKLFVTRAEVARFVYLPSFISTERTAAVYRSPDKAGSLPGAYWVTATEASEKLWPCIPIEGQNGTVDPGAIKVRRDDAPLPASTGKVIGELWLAMLERSQPPPGESLMVDSTILIFSAIKPGGALLRARADSVKGNSKDLWEIGESLIEYGRAPASKRVEFARRIERDSVRLLKRISRK